MDQSAPKILETTRRLAALDDSDRLAAFKKLSEPEAIAARLWIYLERESFDPNGALGAVIEQLWKARGGDDVYEDVLRQRDRCGECAEIYRLENLSICPNCFRLTCYRHKKRCSCGHLPVG